MHITSLETFEELHCLIYCAAVAVLRTMGARILSSSQNKTGSKYTPPWERRIVSSIAELRKNIGRLTQYKNGIRSKKVMDTARQIFKKFAVHSVHEEKNKFVDDFLDTLKQKLSVKTRSFRTSKL
jgi:hypothetical protein